ncbi:MAG: carboxypeptidase-like regulatory domain-containing protein [Candidatus Sulfotelmatobacter sp.]
MTCPRLQPGLLAASWSSSRLLLTLAFLLGLNPFLTSAAQQVKPGQPYALIFGTVWDPDSRPVYGVRVTIRRSTDKPRKVRWELYSDHHGEFAQRVPAGESDYIISADLKGVKFPDGAPAHAQEVTVHVYNDEREDTGVHLTR